MKIVTLKNNNHTTSGMAPRTRHRASLLKAVRRLATGFKMKHKMKLLMAGILLLLPALPSFAGDAGLPGLPGLPGLGGAPGDLPGGPGT